nr:L-aspartate oxidase [Pseudanabaena sp. PCC 6802]
MTAKNFDAVVIGAGAAGLYTALSLADKSSGDSAQWQIALIAKDNLSISASDWAQGGIAAVVAGDDSPSLHADDTLKAGAGLCEPSAVAILVASAKQQIENLLALGVDFDRHGQSLAVTLEAAHSRRRVLHAADATGRALVSTLAARVLANPNVHVFDSTLALDLYLNRGRCAGVFCVSLAPNSMVECLLAPVVVLATGGGAQVFAQTTNPPSSTGDGVAIAWRAGAAIRDMEFVQFHPTALAVEGAPRFLISEAVRGEGAYLVDANGRRFVFDYDSRGELAPRDIVSRAVFKHLSKTGDSTVFLDLQAIAPETISRRFPNIMRICQNWQIDIFSTPIPVTPAAHYCMGGIVTDTYGATSIPGLYAVGETASTGVHGANRLASNSLLECFVFGARLAERVRDLLEVSEFPAPVNLANLDLDLLDRQADREEIGRLQMLKSSLQELTWQAAGICRSGAELETALSQIQVWRQEITAKKYSDRLWVETRNLMDFAYLLVRSALFRSESRGAHYRIDYPQIDPEWQVHTVIQFEEIWRSTPLASQSA